MLTLQERFEDIVLALESVGCFDVSNMESVEELKYLLIEDINPLLLQLSDLKARSAHQEKKDKELKYTLFIYSIHIL